MTGKDVKNILDSLNTLQENLLSLPDDMLLNIDPRDNDSLDQGTQFIKAFNTDLNRFIEVAAKIESQIKTHFGINPEEEEVEKETANRHKRDRIIKELDQTQPHYLDENFTYKRPFGFILGDAAYKGLKTWKNLYMQVLRELHDKDPNRFAKLPTDERFISKRGNPSFATTPDKIRIAEEIYPGFFVEINLSANMIIGNVKELLAFFEIDPKSMKIYLREDRDASEKN